MSIKKSITIWRRNHCIHIWSKDGTFCKRCGKMRAVKTLKEDKKNV